MQQKFETLTEFLNHDFDTVIDVRSPSEFAEDHIPGAINLPVLSDLERAEVGTIYKQVSPFDARKRGAALVAWNTAAHLQTLLADKPGDWKPLVYCWRGGQRSGSFATILNQIGWRVGLVSGGYQSWRRLVNKSLYEIEFAGRIVLLDGYTGTAKTKILQRVGALGAQVIDLEGMANHRGSLLGAWADEQPSQKAFEGMLATKLGECDPSQPILIEAESNKIGTRNIPPILWEQMKHAPAIMLDAPLSARADYLVQNYADLCADPDALLDRMSPLRALRGADILTHWQDLLAQGDLHALATSLMQEHYDPAYSKSKQTRARPILAELSLADLSDAACDRAAQQILEQLR